MIGAFLANILKTLSTIAGLGSAAAEVRGYHTTASVSWTGNDGTVAITVPLGSFFANATVDLKYISAIATTAGTAANYTLHLGQGSFTVGDRNDRYVSTTTSIGTPVREATNPTPRLATDASGNLYLFVVPDATTTDGSADFEFNAFIA